MYSSKTLVLRAFPANLYFGPETAEGDVTITSLLVDLSEPLGFPLVRICAVIRGKGTTTLGTIHLTVKEISQENETAGKNSPSPSKAKARH